MFVLNAKNSFDVDANQNVVEITTTRWRTGTGWCTHTDFLYTRAQGNWNEIQFNKNDAVKYVDFLNTMVEKNVEVARKMAQISSYAVIDYGSWSDSVRLMNSLTVLDPTFVPPVINLNCRWQRELLETLTKEWTQMVISTCRNINNLTKYTKEINLF
jgi:hypothetical protein